MKFHSFLLVVFVFFIAVDGSLFVKYETHVNSPISIPIESNPPTKLINAPEWLSISDNDKEEDSNNGQPTVLLLKGLAKEPGIWTFDIADQVGIVSIQIHVTTAENYEPVKPERKATATNVIGNPATVLNEDEQDQGNIVAANTNEVLEPSNDQSLVLEANNNIQKRRRRRRTLLAGSGGGSIGTDDEDYDEDEDDDDDYEEEDEETGAGNNNDLLEERKVPIEPTPIVHHQVPNPTATTTSRNLQPQPQEEDEPPFSTRVVVEITPTAASTQIPPHQLTSPLYTKLDYIEYGSGGGGEEHFEPPTARTTTTTEASTTTAAATPSSHSFRRTHINLGKFVTHSGKLFKSKIPNDLFTPMDGSTKIQYNVEGADNWIWISDNEWIHALPVDKDISDYNLTLTAERLDSGEKAGTELLVSVRQSRRWRLYNHEIEVEWGKNTLLEERPPVAFGGKGEGKLIEDGVRQIRKVFGGNWETDDIIVRKFETDGITFKLSYTNETLLGAHLNSCPVTELEEIAEKLVKKPFDIVSIRFTGGTCEGTKAIVKSSEPLAPIPPTRNFPPVLNKQIDLIEGIEGEYLIRQVPPDFCYDPEDNYARSLKLTLLDENIEPLNESNWLQFDEKNQEFYGLPSATSSGSYTLKCTDSGNLSVHDALEVSIKLQPITPQDNYLTFNLHFKAANFKPATIRKFMNKLAAAFNDSDLSKIIVKKYHESPSGNITNVHFTWINSSNPSTEYEITELRRIMLSNDGPPKLEFIEAFKPEFHISMGELIPSRIMIGSGSGTMNEDVKDKVSNAGVGGDDDYIIKKPEWMDSSQYLITYVIPGILIFIMILLAVLIACLLTRQSNKSVPQPKNTRYNVAGKNNAILKKGVPVIFQDEYYDEGEHQALNEPTSRSPAILRDEHPPLPPEYRRHNVAPTPQRNSRNSSGGSGGVPHSGNGNNMNIQTYQPPPGFIRTNPQHQMPRPAHHGFGGARGSGRNPPPYVPH